MNNLFFNCRLCIGLPSKEDRMEGYQGVEKPDKWCLSQGIRRSQSTLTVVGYNDSMYRG